MVPRASHTRCQISSSWPLAAKTFTMQLRSPFRPSERRQRRSSHEPSGRCTTSSGFHPTGGLPSYRLSTPPHTEQGVLCGLVDMPWWPAASPNAGSVTGPRLAMPVVWVKLATGWGAMRAQRRCLARGRVFRRSRLVRGLLQRDKRKASYFRARHGGATVQWSGREDLNLRPQRPERCALPGCATPRLVRNGSLCAMGSRRTIAPRNCNQAIPGRQTTDAAAAWIDVGCGAMAGRLSSASPIWHNSAGPSA